MIDSNCVKVYETNLKSGRDFIFKIVRLATTLSFLTKKQIIFRIFYLLRRKFKLTKFNDRLLELVNIEISRLSKLEHEDICFGFLNKSIVFAPEKIKWESKSYQKNEVPEKLWIYNLNYFSWLFDDRISDISKQIALLSWITQNPNSKSEAWEPYPTSLRIVNWAKWVKHGIICGNISRNTAESIYKCIETQISRLYADLEFHNLGNHLLANLCSVIIVYGILQNDIKIDKKIYKNVIICFMNQLKLQILDDGAHVERCPSYHSEMLEMILETKEQLKKFNEIEFVNICNEYALKMKKWLSWVIHPDKTLALFGDTTKIKTAFNCDETGNCTKYLSDSGYFIYKTSEIYFIMKLVGPAPDYNPGHSHCDLLSYEFSLGNEKIITDTGVGSYQNEVIRQHCRTSFSHNIPMVEHTEQSDIYGLFRIGSRAKLISASYDDNEKMFTASMIDCKNQIFKRKVKFGEDCVFIYDSLEQRTKTGTFVSLVHKFKNKDIKNYKVEIIAPKHRIVFKEHLIYPDFGKPKEVEKAIISNKEESEITYAITWKKA